MAKILQIGILLGVTIDTLAACDAGKEERDLDEELAAAEPDPSPLSYAPNEDIYRCLAAASSTVADAQERYCSNLWPASRRDRCRLHESGSAEDWQDWCRAEWSNKPPRGPIAATSPRPWEPAAECEPFLQSGAEPAAPDDCCVANPPPCCPSSPIVFDLDGDGFDLTDAIGGVDFDIIPNGDSERVSWTSQDSDDAWLALDRNGNGTIDNGLELFGNYTSQPPSDNKNGFIALAVFDDPSSGGNGDGQIDSQDQVYSELQLWHDGDHNGLSEPEELFGLSAPGIVSISLDYERSNFADEHGNRFRYRSTVNVTPESHVGLDIYDVFLVLDNSSPAGLMQDDGVHRGLVLAEDVAGNDVPGDVVEGDGPKDATALDCIFVNHGDVEMPVNGLPVGLGWWTNVNCSSNTATVKVKLYNNYLGVWEPVTGWISGVRNSAPPQGGPLHWVEAPAPSLCPYRHSSLWRAVVDVDVHFVIDPSDTLIAGPVSLPCSYYPPEVCE